MPSTIKPHCVSCPSYRNSIFSTRPTWLSQSEICTKEDDRVVFELFKSSRELGEGFALHDRPNLAYLRNLMFTNGWCFIFEDSTTGIIIGFLSIRQSPYHRSQQLKCATGSLVIRKQYQVIDYCFWIRGC